MKKMRPFLFVAILLFFWSDLPLFWYYFLTNPSAYCLIIIVCVDLHK